MPSPEMRIIHKRLIRWIRGQKRLVPISASGSRPGDSVFKSVFIHKKTRKHSYVSNGYTHIDTIGWFPRHFFCLDIKDAFPSVSVSKMTEALLFAGLDPNDYSYNKVISILERYCFTKEDGLIVGANASPDLFNIYAEYFLDRNLRRYCHEHSLVYTRYLDDLIFSSNKTIGKRKRKSIYKFIDESGLKVNEKKTKIYDLRKGCAVINGIGVNEKGRMFIPRQYLDTLRGYMNLYLKGKIELKFNWLRGKMNPLFQCQEQSDLLPNRTEGKVFDLFEEVKVRLKFPINTSLDHDDLDDLAYENTDDLNF